MDFTIRIAQTDHDVLCTYHVIKQLQPHIAETDYLKLVRLQQKEVGFQLAYLTEENKVTCVAGFRFCRSFGWGKYLYVDDLVTDDKQRSHGSGKRMLEWLVNHARESDCHELRLDSATYRHDAHRFYLRERMDIVAFHFKLKIL